MSAIIEIAEARIGQYAGRIKAAWQKAAESIIETGRLLVEAKETLPGGFQAMVASDLPFGVRTAEMLMAIAAHPVLGDAKHVSCLPPSWATLYQLTKLPDDVLRARIADGTINPKFQRKTVVAMRQSDDETTSAPATEDDLDRRARVNVPAGKTLVDIAREAAQLQAAGAGPKDAARQVGVSERAYREAWTIVRLSERNDLGTQDAATVRAALAEMNRTRRTHRGFMSVKPIAERVWGRNGVRDDGARQRRLDEFNHAITFLADTCLRGSEINVPHLADEEIAAALRHIREAHAALRQLATRIERSKS